MQSDPEGSLWRDPPGYFDDIVYPAYVRAHTHVFEAGDVEQGAVSPPFPTEKDKSTSSDIAITNGQPGEVVEDGKRQGRPVENLLLLDCLSMNMDQIFERACEAVYSASQRRDNGSLDANV